KHFQTEKADLAKTLPNKRGDGGWNGCRPPSADGPRPAGPLRGLPQGTIVIQCKDDQAQDDRRNWQRNHRDCHSPTAFTRETEEPLKLIVKLNPQRQKEPANASHNKHTCKANRPGPHFRGLTEASDCRNRYARSEE